MKHKSRILELTRSIALGLVCFLLLTGVLCVYQLVLSVLKFQETAQMELQLVVNEMDSVSSYDAYIDDLREINKLTAQQAVLLLEDQELSVELLEDVRRQLGVEVLLIFQQSGDLRCLAGEKPLTDAFLEKLFYTRSEVTDDGYIFAALPLREDLMLAVGIMAYETEEDFHSAQKRLDIPQTSYDLSGEIMASELSSGKIIYGPDQLLGKNIRDLILVSAFDDSVQIHLIKLDNSWYLAAFMSHGEYVLYSYSDLGPVFFNFRSALTPALMGFGLLILLLVSYAQFVRTDMRLGRIKDVRYVQVTKKRYLNTMLLRKLAAFALVGILCISCILYCLQLMIRSEEERQQAGSRLQIAADVIAHDALQQEEQEMEDLENLLRQVEDIRSMLDFQPALINQADLASIARLYNIEDLFVIDDDGKVIATNSPAKRFTVSTDPQDPANYLWDVINGFSAGFIQYDQSDASGGEGLVQVGVPRDTERGMILANFSDYVSSHWTQSEKVTAAFDVMGIDGKSTLLAVDTATGECVFDSSSRHNGQLISEFGLKNSYVRSGYSGAHMYDGQECLLTAWEAEELILLYVTPTDWIVLNSLMFTALVVFVSLAVIFMTLLPQLLVRSPGEDIAPLTQKSRKSVIRRQYRAAINQAGELELEEGQTERPPILSQWDRKNAGQKLRAMITTVVAFCVLILCYLLFIDEGTSSNNILARILQRTWDKRVNVYSISYVSIFLVMMWLGERILQRITRFVIGSFGPQWKTANILVRNVIRYTSCIIAIVFSLQNFGVETSALITSAGLLTLVFGLGAQSLVADLLAGAFLIFERTFRVGDIVTIDSWRGEVVEIGLRSTKVKNIYGNVKVFQNSKISGAINMTSDRTYAICDVVLPMEEPLAVFEQALQTEFFPYLRAHMPEISHEPVYQGVVSMLGNILVLRIVVNCKESDREQLQRDMYRNLKQWMELKGNYTYPAVIRTH